MTRRRFYVPRDLIRENSAILPSAQAHHLRDVLRIHPGDKVEIFDGAGSGYEGRVEMHGSEVTVLGLTPIASIDFPFRLTLAAALIKPAKFEWILEKCTELGVDQIIPLKTRWSDVRIPEDKIESRMERWDRILTESSRQCKRFSAPHLERPLEFPSFLALEDFSACTKILFYEKALDPWRPAKMITARTVVCIGPEGGWDAAEVEQAQEAGYQAYGLGPWILRAETAAIAAVSIIQHHLNLFARHSADFHELTDD
jgi:16S rRNA (uracil1498-N3)-methyltransferase